MPVLQVVADGSEEQASESAAIPVGAAGQVPFENHVGDEPLHHVGRLLGGATGGSHVGEQRRPVAADQSIEGDRTRGRADPAGIEDHRPVGETLFGASCLGAFRHGSITVHETVASPRAAPGFDTHSGSASG